MIRLANVLIIDGDRSRSAALRERLAGNSYHATEADTPAAGLALVEREHPDLVLIAGSGSDDGIATGAVIKSNPATSDIPVLVMAGQVSSELCTRALEAGLDDVIADGGDESELMARLRPLVRLAIMHAELHQRAMIARQFGVIARDRVDTSASARPVLLVIGDHPGAVATILDPECEITVTDKLYEAAELLTRRNFDAAILTFKEEPEGLLGFCSEVRNNPRLFNLPMVLLAGGGISHAEAYRRGATRVLARPADPAVLRAAVLMLVRRQQLRWAIRGALNDSLQEATRDTATGAYNRAFFEAHLAGRLAVAQAQGRHLAVLFFSAPNIDGVRQQFGDDAALHLCQQLGQWISGLLRAEDLVALYRRNEFCVVLPDTPLAEAEVVMHRIAGVLAYTDFAVRDVYQPVKVWVQVGSTDVRAGDNVAALLARARHNLD
ncbi:MAG: diguanylate cyclase [Magnetospirillum sp.]|nr:diguanylate cyclase [Magnetospirillum sp.]